MMALVASSAGLDDGEETGVGATLNPPATIKWRAPSTSFFKINFDGSVCNNSTASGFIIRYGMEDLFLQLLSLLIAPRSEQLRLSPSGMELMQPRKKDSGKWRLKATPSW